MIAVISDTHIGHTYNTDPLRLREKLIDNGVTTLIGNGDIIEGSKCPPYIWQPAAQKWFKAALEGTQVERFVWNVGNHDSQVWQHYIQNQYDWNSPSRPRKYSMPLIINDGEPRLPAINGQDYGLKSLSEITGVNTLLSTEITINDTIKIVHGEDSAEWGDFAHLIADIMGIPCKTLDDMARISYPLSVLLSEGISNSGDLTDKLRTVVDCFNANGKLIKPLFKRIVKALDKEYDGNWLTEKLDGWAFEKGIKIILDKIRGGEYNNQKMNDNVMRYDTDRTKYKIYISGHTHESGDVTNWFRFVNTGKGSHIALIDGNDVTLEAI